MAKENRGWEWLRDGTNGKTGPALQNFTMNRVENIAMPAGGMCDVEGAIWFDGDEIGRQFWIELKRVDMTTKLKEIAFEPGQIPFLEKRWKTLKGYAWLLVFIGEGKDMKRYLIRGCDARRFEDSFTLADIEDLSVIDTKASPGEIIYAAAMKAW